MTEEEEEEEEEEGSGVSTGVSMAIKEKMNLPQDDDFGDDPFSIPPPQAPLPMKTTVGFDRREAPPPTPPLPPATPAGYVCHRCKVPGHLIQHCPTNGDPNYDIVNKGVKVVTVKKNSIEKEIIEEVGGVPPELRCPLCRQVMKDAVFTSRCCFRSFCDGCIREYTLCHSACSCGAKNVLLDHLLPNKTLRATIVRIMESSAATSSSSTITSSSSISSSSSSSSSRGSSCSNNKVEAPQTLPQRDDDINNKKRKSCNCYYGGGGDVSGHLLKRSRPSYSSSSCSSTISAV